MRQLVIRGLNLSRRWTCETISDWIFFRWLVIPKADLDWGPHIEPSYAVAPRRSSIYLGTTRTAMNGAFVNREILDRDLKAAMGAPSFRTSNSGPAPNAGRRNNLAGRCQFRELSSQRTVRPFLVVVAAINSTTADRLVSGRPRQFWVMWQNRRCSILFHFDVPGG